MERLSERLSALTGRRSPPEASGSNRERRRSDPDRITTALRKISIGSKDGSRQLPLPESQSHIRGTAQPEPEETKPTPSPPLAQHHCTATECAVTKMFETTELLEIVLGFLDTGTVLTLRRTSRQWNETVRKSPTLRLHHFVHPQWSRHAADFQLLDLKIPGLNIEPGDDVEMGKWVLVNMTSAAARQICPDWIPGRRPRARSIYEGLRGGLGRKAQGDGDPWPAREGDEQLDALQHENLHIIQPPILGMQAFVIDPQPFAGPSTPSKDVAPRAACAKLHCDSGITLGFLAETTLMLLLEPGVPSAEPASRSVQYKAIVSFASPNPAPRKRGTARSVTRLM